MKVRITNSSISLWRIESQRNRVIVYFNSGWAFLIPYLGFYLLYFWQKWPANSLGPPALGSGGSIPALLHVYWAIHAIHLVLAILVLLTSHYPHAQGYNHIAGENSLQPESEASKFRSKTSTISALRFRAIRAACRTTAPWIMLVLIFAIPGVYLEWPSDAWLHLWRITDWSIHGDVSAYSSGYKSFYFLAYSLVGCFPATYQLFWLNAYYVSMCVLLSWQYYLTGQAFGLSSRWSFLFVIANVLSLGNSCFSFYRYYGLGSSLFAQIGAVALVRIVFRAVQLIQHPSAARYASGKHFRSLRHAAIGCAILTVIISFSHVQGLAMVGLELIAIGLWWALFSKSISPWLLATSVLIVNVFILLWWPRSSDLESYFSRGGWFNPWYGFDIFSLHSPANLQLINILGVAGCINLGAGFLLVLKNNIVGWITITPVLLLALPIGAIPFAEAVARSPAGISYIFTYNRILFAIPSGLAVIILLHELSKSPLMAKLCKSRCQYYAASVRAGAILALGCATTIPSNGPSYNRVWHLFMRVPADLALQNQWNFSAALNSDASKQQILLPGYPALAEIQHRNQPVLTQWHLGNSGNVDFVADLIKIDDFLLTSRNANNISLIIIRPEVFVTPYSLSGALSGHWLPQIASLRGCGMSELQTLGMRRGFFTVPLPQFAGD